MKMFAFLFFMLSFATRLSIVDDSGAGADAGDAGSSDGGGADENTGADNADDGNGNVGDQEIDDAEGGDASLSAEEIKAAKEIIAENKREAMLKNIEKSIQSRTPDFDMNKVKEGLSALNEKDPNLAAYYNSSEAGLEMFFKEKIANVATSDEINSGSHSGGNSDFESALEKARSGDKKSVKSLLAMSKG